MPEYMELALSDGSQVRLELSGAGEPLAVPSQGTGTADLPEGFGAARPVASGPGRAAALAADALRTALRPLGPLLDEVHGAVSASENPPQEITVAFGVEIGQDLKLGIVGANGKATMSISATWQSGTPRN
ncbi:CU044_2847 family protein [Streptomyces sp. NBC_01481]|uniref:CU044_2847 family protein n=1 Tax=Streptomyces sp. NBC_01481 TaxID=2975869 RepID=UPI00225A39EB|nr:CU044_2847 family protein [Streptomyces sp. NBC_01481]MCX4585067.1 CU044_2847 family protein [Streptomyces sp. NBC_01481]